ncbi:MAG: hypothetical protein WCD80_01365 [Desulfobaccales bacterium]
MKQFLQKGKLIIIQLTIILLISFSLGEISLRIYHHFNPAFIFYSNSYNRYRGKPYADDWDFKLNSRGFKDKEFTEKKEHTYRIIGIGDSFAFGVVPYRYNYLTLLESQLLRDNINGEVLNMGIPSIGPKEYLSLFVNEGIALKPDMLLLTFYIGNDFTDCFERKRDLYSYSYVASLINYLINLSRYEGNVINSSGVYYDDQQTFDKKTYLHLMEKRSFIFLEGNESFMKLLNSAVYYLSIINDICKNKNIVFIVVVAPDELQINCSLQSAVIEAFYPNLNRGKWNITLPNKMLTDRLDKLGIKYIDLYPFFREKSPERLYRPKDTHWNIAGNQLAANIIEEHILSYVRELSTKYRSRDGAQDLGGNNAVQ